MALPKQDGAQKTRWAILWCVSACLLLLGAQGQRAVQSFRAPDGSAAISTDFQGYYVFGKVARQDQNKRIYYPTDEAEKLPGKHGEAPTCAALESVDPGSTCSPVVSK